MSRADDLYKKIITEGEMAIDELIISKQSEDLFLDFKRSAFRGEGRVLDQADRDNLAKAISGFGNSEGGIIIWGVDCSNYRNEGDIPNTKVPINSPRRFVSWLQGAVSGCTVPPHSGVLYHPILVPDTDSGFVVSYIPKSDHAPLQTARSLQFYMRAGSSFSPVPHAVLAGMFGKRPQPNVYAIFTVGPPVIHQGNKLKISIGFMVRNQGPVIASDLFLNTWNDTPGPNCDLGFRPPVQNEQWTAYMTFGRHMTTITRNEVRLPPESQLQPFTVELLLAPPFSRKFLIEVLCGCGQAPPYRCKIEPDAGDVERVYIDFMGRYRGKSRFDDEDLKLFSKMFNEWLSPKRPEEEE